MGCRLQSLGSRVQCSGFRVYGPGLVFQGSGFRVWGLRFSIKGFAAWGWYDVRVEGFVCRFWGLGLLFQG